MIKNHSLNISVKFSIWDSTVFSVKDWIENIKYDKGEVAYFVISVIKNRT